eukprot:SAG11_NODE_6414_length_1319_cov_0.887705_1_plen_96_part_00
MQGQTRVRVDKGWLSVISASGVELMQREECVVVSIRDITTVLRNFRFKVNKTTFPSIRDNSGVASATIKFSAQLKFSMLPGAFPSLLDTALCHRC